MYRLVVCLASIPLLYTAPSVPSEPVVASSSVPPEPIVGSTSVQPLAGSLWNLRQVGVCTLHYSPIRYNNYGCWCGFGGSHEPIDEIDKCCMHHDNCYRDAVENKLCRDTALEYVLVYNWQCTNSTATCLDAEGTCKRALCDCDTAVVNCWAQQPRPKRKLRCNRTRPAPTSVYFQP
uniref:Phospholipase A2 n=1 Tax=Haemonchus contortus TaxID=6289 RepID=A0A7I4Y0C0_HAECO|nr:Phospholipase A2 domain containing protein [Haemonchus contortus]